METESLDGIGWSWPSWHLCLQVNAIWDLFFLNSRPVYCSHLGSLCFFGCIEFNSKRFLLLRYLHERREMKLETGNKMANIYIKFLEVFCVALVDASQVRKDDRKTKFEELHRIRDVVTMVVPNKRQILCENTYRRHCQQFCCSCFLEISPDFVSK